MKYHVLLFVGERPLTKINEEIAKGPPPIYLPRIGEHIIIGHELYRVVDVLHDVEEDVVKVNLVETPKWIGSI